MLEYEEEEWGEVKEEASSEEEEEFVEEEEWAEVKEETSYEDDELDFDFLNELAIFVICFDLLLSWFAAFRFLYTSSTFLATFSTTLFLDFVAFWSTFFFFEYKFTKAKSPAFESPPGSLYVNGIGRLLDLVDLARMGIDDRSDIVDLPDVANRKDVVEEKSSMNYLFLWKFKFSVITRYRYYDTGILAILLILYSS